MTKKTKRTVKKQATKKAARRKAAAVTKATIGGFAPTAAARWMGSKGLNFEEATAALAHYGVQLERSGLVWQLTAGTNRKGVYGMRPIPEIGEPLASELLAFKADKAPVAPTVARKKKKAAGGPTTTEAIDTTGATRLVDGKPFLPQPKAASKPKRTGRKKAAAPVTTAAPKLVTNESAQG